MLGKMNKWIWQYFDSSEPHSLCSGSLSEKGPNFCTRTDQGHIYTKNLGFGAFFVASSVK